MKTFTTDIFTLQPSQLFISTLKLKEVEKQFLENKILDPISIKKLNGKIIMTDGHTRAYYLYKLNRKSIDVFWDTDEMDWDLYQLCVDWCVENNINSIDKLDGRLLDHENYKIEWIDRCQTAKRELDELREKRKDI